MKDWKFHCVILAVREDASAKEVRRAYRRLALERHPDKHNNSTRAKEDFQQLNESYRFVMSGLIEGRKPAPPTPQNRGGARSGSDFQAPAHQRTTSPGLRGPEKKRGYWKIWLHAGIACAVLLTSSLLLQIGNNHTVKSEPDKRDLFIKSWCLIAKPGETDRKSDVFEYWSEGVCKEKCKTLVIGRDLSCSWNSVEFHAAKSSRSPVDAKTEADAKPKEPQNSDSLCEISLERTEGNVTTANYNHLNEKACRNICVQRSDSLPRAGIHCTWAGNQIFQQPLFHPAPESDPYLQVMAMTPNFDSEATSTDVNRRDSCFMTVVTPGSPLAVSLPGETESSCAEHCKKEILANPLDRVVRCAFGGKEIINHVPDPLVTYLARNPAEVARGIQMGNTVLANCEIYGIAGGLRVRARASATTATDCDSQCRSEIHLVPKTTIVSCTFAGKEFLREEAQ